MPGLTRPSMDRSEPYCGMQSPAIWEGVIIRHPWLDGNKRTGYVLMELVLLDAGKELVTTENEKYDMTIRVAEGKSSVEEILAWIEARVKKA